MASGWCGVSPYQYVVLRCVPRVEREEFVNVGVVVYCQQQDFLGCAGLVDENRLRALSDSVDVDAVRSALAFAEAVCSGDVDVPDLAGASLGTRFGFLKAPRSTVVQPGPVHGGQTPNPSAELDRLVACLVTPS